MGRITLFTVDDCVHCTRLTNALNEQELPYTEISLSTHPHRRTDMLSLTDRLTLPQVFFNERHVGGADDTFQALGYWLMDPAKTVQEHYIDEVASLPDPQDERLKPSTEPPVEASKPPPRSPADRIQLPTSSRSVSPTKDGSSFKSGKESASVLAMMEKLRKILPCEALKSKKKICKQSFTGAQAVKALRKEYKISESKAVKFGEYLRQSQIFHSVLEDVAEFVNDEKCLYRLQCYQTPNVLNSYRVWNTLVDSDYMGILHRLKRLLDKVEKEVTNRSSTGSVTGGQVNYTLVRSNKTFPVFEEAVCELQRVDISKLDANTVKAFGINVYNLFIKYAFFKVGIGSNSRSRSAFFNGVKFQIGNEIFSFGDWEHGFLRANRKAPYSLTPQFRRKDPRIHCALPDVDCRIHFALNCGAKSCPPMRTFTADGIEEELRIVSQAFCEGDDNVEINVEKRTVCLNKILCWYQKDFASSERDLLTKLVQFLRGEKQAQLKQLLEDGKSIQVCYKKYDWSTNASEFVAFDSAVLKADIQRFGSRFGKIRKSMSFQ